MPRNGSGVYGPPAGTAAVPNTPIESAKYNAFVADAAEALTASVNVNGTAPYQASQPMGGFRLTNMGAGAAASDSANLGQAQSGIVAHAVSVGGTGDAITAAFSPPFAAYTAKMRFRFSANAANTIAAPTVNVDGLGAKTIKKLNGVALGIGDIAGAGHVCHCVYDGTDVFLLNPALVSGGGLNLFTARQTFNGPLVKGTTILADAATIAWDLSTSGPNYEVTITSNRTLGAFTGATAGQEGNLTVKQDGTGGWSLNLGNAVYKFWGPSIENIARGPNDETVYEYKVISPTSMILRRKGATTIGGPGSDLLATATANNSANVNFILTKWLAIYDRFDLHFEDVVPQTDDAYPRIRVSTDGGANYDSGTSDYKWCYEFQNPGNGIGGNVGAAAAQIEMVHNAVGFGFGNATGETGDGVITLYSPGSAKRLKITYDITWIPANQTTFFVARQYGIGIRDANQDTDAIRFFFSSGNIVSGIFRLYGVRG